jgi:hypothetical protein
MGGTGAAVILQGIDPYALWDPMFEGARIVLNQRGERLSPATVQGLSGGAFRIGGICPCAPTVAPAMGPQDLVVLLGYRAEWLSLVGEGVDAAAWPPILERIKEELRAGRAVLLWHAFTMLEWDVVAGYDDVAGTFLGRGAYAGREDYASAPQGRAPTGEPALGAVLIGERVATPDLGALEVASLREAVRHARSQENASCAPGEPWRMRFGLACWGRWIEAFRQPDYVAGNGDHYCLGVYRTTHAQAAPYLRDVAEHHPAAAAHLLDAAEAFAAEADALGAAADLFPGWGLPREADADLNRRVAERLQVARDAYARGIDAVEGALRALRVPSA